MDEELHIDIDMTLSSDLRNKAQRLAELENPANLVAPPTPGVQQTAYTLAVSKKKWRPGRVLTIRFMDGRSEVQRRLIETALEWTRYANLTFDFGDHARADLRITFANPGSWSYIGTDALVIAQDKPTLNFGWLRPDSSREIYSQVVLHEFGHAIGCIHEHQTYDAEIPWNRPAVYAYYMGPPNNWSKDYVDHNIFDKYAEGSTNHSEFDPESIMVYPIPNAHTLGDFEIGWNNKLSTRDKEFIGTVYPRQ